MGSMITVSSGKKYFKSNFLADFKMVNICIISNIKIFTNFQNFASIADV
jgi:hypothetical protein